jgi:ribosomal protein S18 acetylase RimI-like enzyme
MGDMADRSVARLAAGVCAAERRRREGTPGCDIVEVDGLIVCVANVDAPEVNTVVVERSPVDAVGALAVAEDVLTSCARPFGIHFEVGRDPSIDDAVRERGLRRLFARPGMVAEISVLPTEEAPEGVEIRKVTSDAEVGAFAAVDPLAFGGSPVVAERFYAARLIGEPDVAAFVAYDDEGPIASAAAYLHRGATGLLGVGVVPRARRRGVGRAITVRAARAFPGADLAWLHPTDMARSMYERLGFRSVSTWEVWVRD